MHLALGLDTGKVPATGLRIIKTFVDLTITVVIGSVESFRLTGIDESIVVVTIPLVGGVTIAVLI